MDHVRKEWGVFLQKVRTVKIDSLAQEFEFQGYCMKGPVADLAKAGALGRHQNNIKRDWMRQMSDMNYDHHVAWI